MMMANKHKATKIPKILMKATNNEMHVPNVLDIFDSEFAFSPKKKKIGKCIVIANCLLVLIPSICVNKGTILQKSNNTLK